MAGASGVGSSGVLIGAGVSGAGLYSTSNSLDIYGRPSFLFDTANSQYRNGLGGGLFTSFSSLSGLTFTRASTGYAQTSGGVLVPFASGVPRITDKGLLIEGARTNLCLQSQTFDNATWTKAGGSVTANQYTAPDGTVTADLFTEDSSAATQHRVLQTPSVAANTSVAVSYHVRRASGARNFYIQLVASGGSDILTAYYNLGTGAMGATTTAGTASLTSATITALGDSWYRCTLTGIISTTAIFASGRYGACNGTTAGSETYTGDGTSGLYLWGGQIESGVTFPSSYIPTTSASVTRAADVASIAVSGFVYPATLFAEFERVVDMGAIEGIMSIGDGASSTSSISINASDLFRIESGGATVGQSNAGAVSTGVVSRGAGRVLTNDVQSVLNGTLGANDATASYPNAITTLILGGNATIGHNAPFGYIKRAAAWSNLAFSNAQLQSVST